jgi:hypothetical protein
MITTTGTVTPTGMIMITAQPAVGGVESGTACPD